MARRKVTKEHIRKIQSSKGSYSVSIPMRLMRLFHWKERQKVTVRKFGKNRIVIADWKK